MINAISTLKTIQNIETTKHYELFTFRNNWGSLMMFLLRSARIGKGSLFFLNARRSSLDFWIIFLMLRFDKPPVCMKSIVLER